MRDGLMTPPTGMGPTPEPPVEEEMPAAEARSLRPLSAQADDPEDPLDPAAYFDGGNASTQEQTQYEYMMGQVMETIHGSKTAEKFSAGLEKANAKTLPQVLGAAALALYLKIEQNMRTAGHDVYDSVRLEVGEGILEELVDVATAMGKVPDDEESVGVLYAGALDVFASNLGATIGKRGNYDAQGGLDHMAELLQVADHKFPMKKTAEALQAAMQQQQASQTGVPVPRPESAPPPEQGGGMMQPPTEAPA